MTRATLHLWKEGRKAENGTSQRRAAPIRGFVYKHSGWLSCATRLLAALIPFARTGSRPGAGGVGVLGGLTSRAAGAAKTARHPRSLAKCQSSPSAGRIDSARTPRAPLLSSEIGQGPRTLSADADADGDVLAASPGDGLIRVTRDNFAHGARSVPKVVSIAPTIL